MNKKVKHSTGGRSPGFVYKRIVVKAGTGVLTTAGGDRLDISHLKQLADQIASLYREGIQIILVSSGAIAAGKGVLGEAEIDHDIPFRQVLAALGQSYLMDSYQRLFNEHGIRVAQVLLTRKDVSDRQGYLNVRNTLLQLIDLGAIPIVNENDVVAVEEIGEGFGDNDTLSALVSNIVDSELLLMLTDTEGLYTKDPQDKDAKLIQIVESVDESIEALASDYHKPWSRGGMVTKLEAAKNACASGTTTVVCNGRLKDIIYRVVSGEEIGTRFLSTVTKLESRKRWLLSCLSVNGEILIDDGAVIALLSKKKSLLPAGVQGIGGEFSRGDVVYIVGLDGKRLACGISNYDSQDIVHIKGGPSNHIGKVLGYQYGEEVVHRNNMVLL